MKQKQANLQKFAEMLYVHEGKDIDAIIDMLKIPQSTAYLWKTKGDWDMMRDNLKANPLALAKVIEQSILKILENAQQNQKGILTGADGDTIAKLSKARKDVLKESNYLGIAFDVLEKFQKYLFAEYPKMIDEKLSDAVAAFLKSLLEKY